MARPKKLKSEAQSTEPTLTETAIGVYKQEDGTYYIAEVIYDPITGEAALEDLHHVASKTEASERFKIEAVKKGFV